MFMSMCPTYTFIDRANGRFNENMTFKREYAALISAAWEIDRAYDMYLKDVDPIPGEPNPLQKIGLYREDDENGLEKRAELIKRLVRTDKSNAFRKRILGDMMMDIDDDEILNIARHL